MPPHLLSTFANGLLMGKILAACPATIPIRIKNEDRYSEGVTEDINKAIKAADPSITKTKLSDKMCSKEVLRKANLKCLNEAVASVMAVRVWKAKQSMNPLGQCLSKEKNSMKVTRFQNSQEIQLPVPGYPNLATNLMARLWNSMPELQCASSLSAARNTSQKWAKHIPR